jgi:hypothetical protein
MAPLPCESGCLSRRRAACKSRDRRSTADPSSAELKLASLRFNRRQHEVPPADGVAVIGALAGCILAAPGSPLACAPRRSPRPDARRDGEPIRRDSSGCSPRWRATGGAPRRGPPPRPQASSTGASGQHAWHRHGPRDRRCADLLGGHLLVVRARGPRAGAGGATAFTSRTDSSPGRVRPSDLRAAADRMRARARRRGTVVPGSFDGSALAIRLWRRCPMSCFPRASCANTSARP